jgi:hypothetical protein
MQQQTLAHARAQAASTSLYQTAMMAAAAAAAVMACRYLPCLTLELRLTFQICSVSA